MAVLSARVKVATLTLTNAQLLALFATPVQIVPAPGAGKVIVPISCHARLERGTTAYSASRNLQVQWTGLTTNLVQTISILFANGPGAVLDQFFTTARTATLTLTAGVDPSNRAVEVTIQTGAITGGSSGDTLKIALLYEEVPSLY
jgi:hypothetical protein